VLPDQQSQSTDPIFTSSLEPIRQPRKPQMLLPLMVLALLLLTAVILLQPATSVPSAATETAQNPVARFTPISSMVGIEMNAALSPHGDYMLYSNSVDLNSDYKLVLQNLRTMESRVIKLTNSVAVSGMVWLANQSGFYYQLIERNKVCEIRRIDLNPNNMQVVADTLLANCGIGGYSTQLQLAPDQQTLFYSSWQASTGNTVIVSHQLETGHIEQLTEPPTSSIGDYKLALSGDGRQLAFLRDVAKNKADVWLMDIASRSTKQLTKSTTLFPINIIWSADQNDLLLAGRNAGLVVVNVATGHERTLLQLSQPIVQVAAESNGRYLVAVGNFWQSDLLRVNNPLVNQKTSHSVVADSSGPGTIFVPNPISGGPAAVVTRRTGEKHLWLYHADGRQQQITKEAIIDEIQTPKFAPNGQHLVWIVGNRLWLFQQGSEPKLLTKTDEQIGTAYWAADSNSIYYGQLQRGLLQIMHHGLTDGQSKLFSTQLQYYQPSADGSYVLQRRLGQDNYEIVRSSDNSVKALLDFKDTELWFKALYARAGGIYFYRKLAAGFDVARYNLQTGAIESTGTVRAVQGRRFDVSLDEQFIYLDDGKKGDIDVGWLDK